MRNPGFHFAAAVLCSLCFILPTALQAQGPVADSPAIEKRVDDMIAKLTLQQKLELIGGVDSMFIRAEPSAGFPMLKMSDGPEGVRTWGPDTAYAGGIALAASWDPKLATAMGDSIAKDARARGVNFLLGPGVNIYRAPMCGRNFEYFGEDPWLAGQTAAAYIRGVQNEGVIATVKHFAANNQEYDRHNVSSDLDERTLREIYLPAFETAVEQGHVGAVMNSYNLLNGVHATENKHLNLDILKGEWKFDGILMSDWDATYSAVGPANNGLDLEMPSGKFMNPQNLLPAVKNGQVSDATIDDKLRRIFRTAIRFGFLDRDQTDPSLPRFSQEGRAVALQEALESITLLKNEGNLLPLDPNKVHTLAVIGPDAWPAVPGAGGSSHTDAYAPVSIMTGLSDALTGKVKVLYAEGLPSAIELMRQTDFYDASGQPAVNPWTGSQVKVETFDNPNLSGTPTVSAMRRIASYRSEDWTPPAKVRRSIRFTAQYMPTKTESFLFLVGASGSDAYKLIIDGKTVLDQPSHEGQAPRYVEVPLTANQPASVELDYWPDSSSLRIGLGIRGVSELVSPEAKKIASLADAAVVAVGFDASTESEGYDRSFELPFGQDQLIQAVSQANPHTLVTITAGGNVDMHRWLSGVPALLHNWYPGQEGGRALAQILTGEHSPEGHLPVSFEKSWEENPVHDSYYAAPVPKGETPHVNYKEGVFVGYRYYTTYDKQPLFPFGFGLSYTTFSFSNLKVSPASSSDDANGYNVSFDVTNTGHREGATVAQVYVGDPSAKVKRPVKELKGYEKVRLAPGETRHVSVALNRRSFAYWSDAKNGWQVDPGKFVFYAGDSSANTPLTQDVEVQ